MCGIAGFWSNHYSSQHLKLMLETIKHRGPDNEGQKSFGNVHLGHRRLSIIDLSEKGNQPMLSSDGKLTITYNGEVYNYKKLRGELEELGHSFYSSCDSEVVLTAYEEWGTRSFEKLDGMFAFAIYNSEGKELVLVRDRYGIKPLYYHQSEKGFFFASELKAIMAVKDLVLPEINLDVIDTYLTLRYVPGEATMMKGVQKLLPGHYIKLNSLGFDISQFSDFKVLNGFNYETSEFDSHFQNAVSNQMVSDVEVGAFLSGGLDSSYIVSKAVAQTAQQLKTFSVGFKRNSELSFAKTVSDQFDTDHFEINFENLSLGELKKIVWHLDEPVGDAATMPTYFLSMLAASKVKVVLSGEGADELLGGYAKYKLFVYLNKLKWLLKPFNWLLPSSKIEYIRLRKFLSGKNFSSSFFEATGIFDSEEKQRLLNTKAKLITGDYTIGQASFEALQNFDIKNWLVDDLFLKNDKMTMAASLESRVPFLDNNFADFCKHLNLSAKSSFLSNKIILRKALKEILPKISKRKKHGFEVPLENLKELGLQIINRQAIEKRGIFNWLFVEALLQKDLTNQFYRRQFVTILMFEVWCQVFIDDVSS
ncbi:MAG: asparagine synthase (glutamine-hydrolyzing) [Cyclobacteriaceae bacterium]